MAPAADNAHQPTTAEAVLFEYDADQAVMQYRMRTGVEPVQACINLVEAAYPSLRGQDWMKGTTPAHGWVALRLVFQFAMEKRYEQWQEKRKVNAEVWQLLSPEEQNKVTLAFARKHPGALFRVEEDLDPILVKQLVDERARKAGHGP